jgi:hypothetical protein
MAVSDPDLDSVLNRLAKAHDEYTKACAELEDDLLDNKLKASTLVRQWSKEIDRLTKARDELMKRKPKEKDVKDYFPKKHAKRKSA